MSLMEMAAQIESQKANEDWAAHKAAFAVQEAEQEAAAYLAEMEEEKALMTAEPESEYGVQATPEKVRAALENGFAEITVRSWKTGKHVTVQIVGRKKKAGGHGWVSRTTTEGRVGWENGADVLEGRDPLKEYPENYVGRLYLDSGEWKPGKDADPIRAWTVAQLLGYAAGRFPLNSDVFLAASCSSCGKKLTDPESIEELIGPECKGKATKSQVAH